MATSDKTFNNLKSNQKMIKMKIIQQDFQLANYLYKL